MGIGGKVGGGAFGGGKHEAGPGRTRRVLPRSGASASVAGNAALVSSDRKSVV